jgi:hypothetical protein
MKGIKIVWLTGVLLSIFCFAAGTTNAGEMPVPPDMQASLFKKIFGYDKKLSTLSEYKIVVAYADASAAVKDEVVKAFQGVGISARALKADQLAGNLGDAAAVYIAAGAVSASSVCQKNQILSITGFPSLVESGTAAIGLGIAEGKPKILVHLGILKAEGHEVSAKLLQLAKVIE